MTLQLLHEWESSSKASRIRITLRTVSLPLRLQETQHSNHHGVLLLHPVRIFRLQQVIDFFWLLSFALSVSTFPTLCLPFFSFVCNHTVFTLPLSFPCIHFTNYASSLIILKINHLHLCIFLTAHFTSASPFSRKRLLFEFLQLPLSRHILLSSFSPQLP